MDSIYDENQNRFKGFSLVILLVSIVALITSTYLYYNAVGVDEKSSSLELIYGSIGIFILSLWFSHQAFTDNNFHPKFKLGELVIHNPRTGILHHHREFPFSKNIEKIPIYKVTALEEHFIFLHSIETEEEMRVYFSDQNDFFSIEEFKSFGRKK